MRASLIIFPIDIFPQIIIRIKRLSTLTQSQQQTPKLNQILSITAQENALSVSPTIYVLMETICLKFFVVCTILPIVKAKQIIFPNSNNCIRTGTQNMLKQRYPVKCSSKNTAEQYILLKHAFSSAELKLSQDELGTSSLTYRRLTQYLCFFESRVFQLTSSSTQAHSQKLMANMKQMKVERLSALTRISFLLTTFCRTLWHLFSSWSSCVCYSIIQDISCPLAYILANLNTRLIFILLIRYTISMHDQTLFSAYLIGTSSNSFALSLI